MSGQDRLGRGLVVDEPALLAALESGRLGGAGLDVFEEEPLPPGSPLWEAPNLVVTHHTAGNYPEYVAQATEGFAQNLRRFLAGEPLWNVVDKDRGY